MTKLQDAEFEKAADAYIDMFGGSLPLGTGMPDLTTELLEKAVKEKKEIEELPLPPGAWS